MRHAQVIGIEDGHPIVTSRGKCPVEAFRLVYICLRYYLYAVIVCGVFCEDPWGTIRRAVIDNDELEIVVRLAEDALYRFGDIPLAVVHRHNYGNGR